MLKARYQLDNREAAELLQSIPIVHVYGKLGDLTSDDEGEGNGARRYAPYATPDTVIAAADSIRIVDETEDDSTEISGARDLLYLSEKVIFLGFGYNATNVRRLKLENSIADKAKLYGTPFWNHALGILCHDQTSL